MQLRECFSFSDECLNCLVCIYVLLLHTQTKKHTHTDLIASSPSHLTSFFLEKNNKNNRDDDDVDDAME